MWLHGVMVSPLDFDPRVQILVLPLHLAICLLTTEAQVIVWWVGTDYGTRFKPRLDASKRCWGIDLILLISSLVWARVSPPVVWMAGIQYPKWGDHVLWFSYLLAQLPCIHRFWVPIPRDNLL